MRMLTKRPILLYFSDEPFLFLNEYNTFRRDWHESTKELNCTKNMSSSKYQLICATRIAFIFNISIRNRNYANFLCIGKD